MLKHKKLFNRYNQKINKKSLHCYKKIPKFKLKLQHQQLSRQQHQQQEQLQQIAMQEQEHSGLWPGN
jgi:hypothetical protein